MVSEELPEIVRKFILERITSVEQIAVLLFLITHSQRKWTTAEISQELRSTEASIQKRILDLRSSGVLSPKMDPGEPLDSAAIAEGLSEPVRALLEAFRLRPNRVIDLIYSRPNESLKAFADAFKIRKDED